MHSGCAWNDLGICEVLCIEHFCVVEINGIHENKGQCHAKSRYTLHALRIRTRSGSAAQRKSRNFNLGSPKLPQLLGSTRPAAA